VAGVATSPFGTRALIGTSRAILPERSPRGALGRKNEPVNRLRRHPGLLRARYSRPGSPDIPRSERWRPEAERAVRATFTRAIHHLASMPGC
jgi:hypothetical protein